MHGTVLNDPHCRASVGFFFFFNNLNFKAVMETGFMPIVSEGLSATWELTSAGSGQVNSPVFELD